MRSLCHKDWSLGVSFLSEIEVKKGGFLIQFLKKKNHLLILFVNYINC